MRTVNSLIGSPIERVEDLRFLRGRGQYVDDLSREGLLHAAILRSSVAHGRIRSLDVSAALALPGVHSVITAKDIGNRVPRVPMRLQPLPDFEAFGQPVIAVSHKAAIRALLALATGWDMTGRQPVKLDWRCLHFFTARRDDVALVRPNVPLV